MALRNGKRACYGRLAVGYRLWSPDHGLLWTAGCGNPTEIPDGGFLTVWSWLGILACELMAEDAWPWIPS